VPSSSSIIPKNTIAQWF